MTNAFAKKVAAVAGFMAVALGAFGAHALKELLIRRQTTGIWEKAVFYHFIHAIMLVVLAQRPRPPVGPWLCFVVGILFFSGSLYALAVTGLAWLGAITPIGGLSLLAGWAWLFLSAARD